MNLYSVRAVVKDSTTKATSVVKFDCTCKNERSINERVTSYMRDKVMTAREYIERVDITLVGGIA